MFTKIPIDCLVGNIVEILKVGLIEWSFDNWIYISNFQSANFYDLPFDVDQRLITRQQIYLINDDIVERLNNGFIVDVYTNQI